MANHLQAHTLPRAKLPAAENFRGETSGGKLPGAGAGGAKLGSFNREIIGLLLAGW